MRASHAFDTCLEDWIVYESVRMMTFSRSSYVPSALLLADHAIVSYSLQLDALKYLEDIVIALLR